MTRKTPSTDIALFADRYIGFFETTFGRSQEANYLFFDSDEFPEECRRLGFKMDGGELFIEKYGEKAWNTVPGLKEKIHDIDDMTAIGNALFSQWRYYNHWSSPSYADDETKEWFLMLLRRMKKLCLP